LINYLHPATQGQDDKRLAGGREQLINSKALLKL